MTEEQNNENENVNEDQDENTSDQNENQNDNDLNEDSEPDTFDYGILLDDDDEEDDSDQNDNNEPEDKSKTKPSKNKSNVLDKVNDHILSQKTGNEIDNYFKNNPEAEEYRSKVEKWVNHPNRMKFIKQGMPVSAVIAEALAPHQQKIGANKARLADQEANSTRDGGSSAAASDPNSIDYSSMTNAQIEQMARDVMNGRYGK